MVQTNMAVPKDSALPSLALGLYPTAMERYPTTGPPKMLPQVSATVLLTRDGLQMSLNVTAHLVYCRYTPTITQKEDIEDIPVN